MLRCPQKTSRCKGTCLMYRPSRSMTRHNPPEPSGKPDSWLVQVNGVSVGRILAADYDRICSQAIASKKLMLLQLLNGIEVLFRFAVLCLMVLWAIGGVALVMMAWAPYAQVPDIGVVMGVLRLSSILALIVVLFVLTLVPGRFGYRNIAMSFIDDQVRYSVHCPAVGTVYLLDDRAIVAATECDQGAKAFQPSTFR